MAPAACRPIIKCGKSGCTGSCPLSVVEYGYKAVRKPASCRACGETFPRPNVTPSDFFPVKSDKKKGNNGRNSRLDSAETPHLPCLEGQVLFPGVTHRAIKRCPKVWRQSWRTARNLIRLRLTRRSEQMTNCVKILTNMPDEHKSLIYGDSLKAKMQSWDDEKVALLAAKRQFLPLQSRIEKQKNYLERISRLRRNNNIVWKFYKNGSRLTRNWMQHTPNRSKPSMKCRFWLPNRPQKMRRRSIRALHQSSHSHHLPTQTQTHNRPSSQCSNLFSRCKTWGATALLNRS